MASPLEAARHEVGRLRAICAKLSELKLTAIKDEIDQLQLLVWSMRRKIEPEASEQGNGSRKAATSSRLGRSGPQIRNVQ